MKYKGKVDFKTQPIKVWDTVLDMEQFVACFPGVDDVVMVDDKTFKGSMRAKGGPVSGDFQFTAQIVEAETPVRLTAEVEGSDSLTNSTMTAEITMSLAETAVGHTELEYESEVKIKGRLGIIGDMVIRATGAQVIEEFFKRLRERVETVPA